MSGNLFNKSPDRLKGIQIEFHSSTAFSFLRSHLILDLYPGILAPFESPRDKSMVFQKCEEFSAPTPAICTGDQDGLSGEVLLIGGFKRGKFWL